MLSDLIHFCQWLNPQLLIMFRSNPWACLRRAQGPERRVAMWRLVSFLFSSPTNPPTPAFGSTPASPRPHAFSAVDSWMLLDPTLMMHRNPPRVVLQGKENAFLYLLSNSVRLLSRDGEMREFTEFLLKQLSQLLSCGISFCLRIFFLPFRAPLQPSIILFQ